MGARLSRDYDVAQWLQLYLPVLSAAGPSKNSQVATTPRDLLRLSVLRVTATQTLELCPRSWATRYLSLEPVASSDNKYSWLGTVAHEVCETYLAGLWGLGDVRDVAIFHALDHAGVSVNERAALRWYVSQALPPNEVIIAIEREFTLSLMPEGAPKIRGHVDLLYEDGDVIVIRDHKTNRRARSVKAWQADLQTLAYGLAVGTLWPGRPRRFEIGYVNLMKVLRWPITAELDELARQRLETTWNRLQTEWARHGPDRPERWLAKPGDHCGFCQLTSCDARPNPATLLGSLAKLW